MYYRTSSYAEGTFDVFYFEKNLQGDIIGVYNSSGVGLISYMYDAWGNCTVQYYSNGSSSPARYNPFRYRGYYFDSDLGLYYLNSRYYDPNTGRFISPEPNVYTAGFDSSSGLIAHNVYAYCANNPIKYSDPTGEFILTAIIVGAAAGAIIGGAIGGTVAYNSAKSSGKSGSDLFWATAGGIGRGALIGGVAGSLVGTTGGVVAAYGATSIAGTAMITGTGTIMAKATEVSALQAKKSINDGDNGWQAANDCIDSVFSNSLNIIGITPFAKSIGVAFNHGAYSIIERDFGGKQTLQSTLKSTCGQVMPYTFLAIAWANTTYSIVCNDPIARAQSRRYILK